MISSSRGDPIVVFQPRPSAWIRLVCFPYAGAGPSAFRAWASSAPLDIEVRAVQLPGRENRLSEPLPDDLNPLTDEIAESIGSKIAPPFAFFGHSIGALLAFDVVRKLHRLGATLPATLFLSACRAPHLPPLHEPIHALPNARFIDRLRELEGMPDAILGNPELMDVFVPILRADMAMSEAFKLDDDVVVDCPLTVLGGTEDQETPMEDLAAWREHSKGPFVLRMYPGGHFFLNKSQDEILRAIHTDLKSHATTAND